MRVQSSWLRLPICVLMLCAGMVGIPVSGFAGAIEAGHSAMWFDPARSGEGWVLEILHNEKALLYWYTYDEEGGQRWLQGVGDIVRNEAGDILEFEEIYITRGPKFGPDYDPDALEIEIVGQASMRFEDCNQGEFSYSAFGQSQTIPIQRLSQTMAGGCAPRHGVTGEPVREYAGQSGSWFDPSLNGQGFSMHWLSRDEALMTWYSYDTEGNQYWMLGVGRYEDGRIVFPEIHSTRGAKFGEAFNSDDVEFIEWGYLEMTLDCDAGTASFESNLAAFGSGTFELDRLTLLKRPGCTWIAPKLWDLYDITWSEIPIPEGEWIIAVSIADDGTTAAVRRSHVPDGEPFHLALLRPGEQHWEIIDSENINGGLVGISPDASTVYAIRAPVYWKREPMIWRAASGWTVLPDLIVDLSYITAPSADYSRFVGFGSRRNENQDYPLIWDAEHGQRRLPVTEELVGPRPEAVSNDGSVVVGDAFQINQYDTGIGVRWVNGGEPEYLYNDQGELLGGARACNHDCSVVVGYGLGFPKWHIEAWYWTPSGRFGWLGTLPDADHIWLDTYDFWDVTWDGNMIVGRYMTRDAEGRPTRRGYIWTQNTGFVTVQSLVDELGIGDNNWNHHIAKSISTTGDKILLEGASPDTFSSGEYKRRAVILELTPKETGD